MGVANGWNVHVAYERNREEEGIQRTAWKGSLMEPQCAGCTAITTWGE
ncbi:hypothetical protein BIFGAL_02729 [Bifidobacterium gallicum DSM 20093 = LMG 11596]|uniref:Uncharacterized protein n=1 Tax=Bifidobacterium gallicum DSM 20093 = LMG 11596 TaxID=561180 RepID=D1NSH2_9BIFI|nr:hypothetical protein BIFGAL_02729 [Bifidobacterium gallicum DSM 20093 = LMG 11596]